MIISGKYYLLASLPVLEAKLGNEKPPISISKFWEKLQFEETNLKQIIQAVLLEHDINNLEQIYHGYKPVSCATIPMRVLMEAFKDTKKLKDYLPIQIYDYLNMEKWQTKIWREYFNYCLGITHKDSTFQKWLNWEVSLKYCFYQNRQNTKSHLWDKITISQDYDKEHRHLLNLYQKASNPLEAELLLDNARFSKILELSTHFSFEYDEIVTYTLSLLLLERWWIIFQNKEDIFQKVIND